MVRILDVLTLRDEIYNLDIRLSRIEGKIKKLQSRVSKEKTRLGKISKAICSNSGLPVPDTDFYDRKRSGQDKTGLSACDCKKCQHIDDTTRKKIRD